MAVYLDSARLSEIRRAVASFPIAGVTTNPTLLRRAVDEGELPRTPLEAVGAILEAAGGLPVFLQTDGETPAALLGRARLYMSLGYPQLVIKVPCSWAGLIAARELVSSGAAVCITAVHTVPQARLSQELGAQWIATYMGRARRHGTQPAVLIQALLAATRHEPPEGRMGAADPRHPRTRLLVASVKSPADAAEAMLAGADDLTAGLDVLTQLLDHPITSEALESFSTDAAWLWQDAPAGGGEA